MVLSGSCFELQQLYVTLGTTGKHFGLGQETLQNESTCRFVVGAALRQSRFGTLSLHLVCRLCIMVLSGTCSGLQLLYGTLGTTGNNHRL